MSDILGQSLNKGVPVATPIFIVYNDLINIFTNKDEMDQVINKHFIEVLSYMFEGTPCSDVEMFKTMTVVTDSDTLEKKICFSPSGFVSSLIVNLNVDSVCTSKQKLSSITFSEDVGSFMEKILPSLEKRISLLGEIGSEKRLQREFPFLYSKYESRKSMQQSLVEIEPLLKNPSIPVMVRLSARAQLMKICRDCGLSGTLDEIFQKGKQFSVSQFTKEYSQTFSQLVDHYSDIFDFLLSHPISFDSIREEDKEKLDLYIAHQFLLLSEKFDFDRQRYLYHVSQYFSEDPSRRENEDIEVLCGRNSNLEFISSLPFQRTNGYVVTPKRLYDRYRKLLVENPELMTVNFNQFDFSGMNLSEVEEFMEEYLKDLSANWEFLPRGDSSIDREVTSLIRNSGSELSEEERRKKQDRLLDLYMQKKEFYDSTDPFFRIKGKNTFDGYIGYIYTNGIVVLDRFYDDVSQSKLADGHAVYIMEMNDFYRLSQLSKTELIQNELCHRVIHRGDWQSRVLSYIEQDRKSANPSEQVKFLVKENKITGLED